MPPSIRFNPWISKTPGRKAAHAAAALMLCTALAPQPAAAAIQPLTDTDLSWITAQGPAVNASAQEILFSMRPVSTTTLPGMRAISAPQFAEDLKALGIARLPPSFYDGRTVFKLVLDVAPFSVGADLSQLLFPVSSSPSHLSLGELRVNQVDVSGTTLWIWMH
jgi:hypothetical protein